MNWRLLTWEDWVMLGVGLAGVSFLARGIAYAIEDALEREPLAYDAPERERERSAYDARRDRQPGVREDAHWR